jgi:carbamoyltransferase
VRAAKHDDVCAPAAAALCEGQVLGWFQGRSELGPRALGQRSILADPRSAAMKDLLNGWIKHREAFRPFAPVVLQEAAHEWFEIAARAESPFMLRVWKIRQDKLAALAAVAHVDGSGRVQTVSRETSPLLYDLVRRFHERTGVPVLLNTSFNVAGEPIVETPDHALLALLCTGLDACVLGQTLVTKPRSYRGILDLVPQISPACASVGWPMRGRFAGPDVSFEVALAWGSVHHTFPRECLRILERVDGCSSGWAIAADVGDEPVVTRVLSSLARTGVVTFQA